MNECIDVSSIENEDVENLSNGEDVELSEEVELVENVEIAEDIEDVKEPDCTEEAEVPEEDDTTSEFEEELSETDEYEVDPQPVTNEEVEVLRREVERLRAELDSQAERDKRAALEYAEFKELYPDVAIESVGEDVRQIMDAGVPLAAAYALSERRREIQLFKTESANKKSAETSWSSVGKRAENGFFSSSEVRKMTPQEVHNNYSLILESMKYWN